MLDQAKIKEAMQILISALGDDITRPGLLETPERAARMYTEMFEGMNYTNDQIAEMFNKSFEDTDSTEWVLVKDINIFSFCEHHFALMYNMKAHIAYKPQGRVIGLSKVSRIADMVAKRLQLQERICADINYVMQKVTGAKDVMVVIEGEHSCMTARGIRAQNSKTRSLCARGVFETDAALRMEVLSQI